MIEHLQEELEKAGVVLKPRSSKEIMEKLVTTEENRYIRKLVALICRFITNFKTNGFTADDFQRMYHSTQNVRTRLFLNICHDCYLEYQRYLKENDAVDFEDMINESARVLREVKEMKRKLDFRYVIVDEYQDISRQRFDLVTALSEVTDAKIIAVGDDWQSIYAFSAYKQEHTRYNILDLLNGSQEVSGFLSLKSRGFTNNFGEIQRRKMKWQGSNWGQDVVIIVVKKFPPYQPQVSPKIKKPLKTNGFQGFNVVEISGIEPLTS